LELRQIIYTYAFTTSAVLVHPSDLPTPPSNARANSIRDFMALCRVCKSVEEEATPIFYTTATLHFSIVDEPREWLKTDLNVLNNVRNLSICYSILLPTGPQANEDEESQSTVQNTVVDRDLACANEFFECIDYFASHCPNFNTATVHLISSYRCYLQPDATGKTLNHGSQVVLAFARLAAKVKHRMTIIACTGYKSLYKPLGAAIAGVKGRHSRNLAQQSCLLWPHMRLQHVSKVLLCDMRAGLRYNENRRARILFGSLETSNCGNGSTPH